MRKSTMVELVTELEKLKQTPFNEKIHAGLDFMIAEAKAFMEKYRHKDKRAHIGWQPYMFCEQKYLVTNEQWRREPYQELR